MANQYMSSAGITDILLIASPAVFGLLSIATETTHKYAKQYQEPVIITANVIKLLFGLALCMDLSMLLLTGVRLKYVSVAQYFGFTAVAVVTSIVIIWLHMKPKDTGIVKNTPDHDNGGHTLVSEW